MKKRIVSAILLIFIAVPFIIIGNISFALFTLLLGEICLYEFLRFQSIPNIINFSSYIILGLVILKDLLNINLGISLIIGILVYLGNLVFNKSSKYNYKDAFFLIGLVIFLGIIFYNIIWIRNNNVYELIYLILVAILSDTFAFLIGKRFGKHKLAPEISPNKTIEGLVGGVLLGSILGSLFYFFLVKKYTNIILIVLLTFTLSITGEFGDLIKSTIKRYEKVKDFSNLIPGHGGIMDRLDSLIFIVAIYTLIINIF